MLDEDLTLGNSVVRVIRPEDAVVGRAEITVSRAEGVTDDVRVEIARLNVRINNLSEENDALRATIRDLEKQVAARA